MKKNIRKNVLLPLLRVGVLAAGLMSGYYKRVFAGSCSYVGTKWVCTGAASGTGADTEISLNNSTLTVTTDPGFGHNTSNTPGADGLNLTAAGALSFTDANNASITGHDNGIWAHASSSSAILSITTSGNVTGLNGDGIYASNRGDVTITAYGDVSGTDNGIVAHSASSNANANDVITIIATGTVTGGSGAGIYAKSLNNDADLTYISAHNVYGGTDGIFVYHEGYTTNGIEITTSGTVRGTTGNGITARVNYTGSPITISANNVSGGKNGIYAYGYYGGTTGIFITTSGDVVGNSGAGIKALGYNKNYLGYSGNVDITVGSTSSVSGSSAGIYALADANHEITITVDGAVQNLSGSSSDAAIIASGAPATINLTGGSVTGTVTTDVYDDTFNWSGGTLSGNFSGGDGSDTAVVSSNAQWDGTQVFDGGDDMATGDGFTDTLAFNGITASGSGANMLNWEIVEVDNASVTLTDGFLEAGDGSAGTGLFLQNGASLYTGPAALDLTAEVDIDASSTLYHAMGGDIFGNVTNAGTIYWQNLGNTLTINGNLIGVAGSQISLETYLNDDSSATDTLHVTGDTTGTTGLVVRAATGSPGGQTIDGIEVIQVDGTSAAGSFTLASAVQAGVYEYILQQGGAVTGGQNWYLVSNYTVPGSAGSNVVIYRPGVANYVGGQQVNNLQGLLQLSTFHQRIGGQFEVDRAGRRTWLRPYYAYQSAEGETRFDFEASFAGMQIGQELMAWEKDGVADRFALTFDFAYTDADFEDRKRPAAGLSEKTGNLDGYSYALGGIWTRTGDAGGYFDAVGQVSWLDNRYHDCYGDDATQHGWRFAVSAEAGKPVVQWLGWQLEPQGQLSYLYTTYEDFSDAASGVSGYDSQALVGRAGIRIFHGEAYKKDDGLQVYGIGNIVYHFIDPASVEIDSTDLEEEYSRTSWEAGAGIIGKVTPAIYVYGDARYEHAFDSTDTYGCRLNAGLRITF
ncbi:autotransporter outer membrane beta-barrel domain-containing protein [Breoghania sp.]|uniref:autotransporter family protein n=1 Tax=Breoghania sp. TaxID=2065378 RepID=UPI0029C7F238|nr:autotransporter outer membrane beta-barrel domain-containing protein [Breoghania sp.]